MIKRYLNANLQTYTRILFMYCTNHKPKNRHFGYMNFQPHPHLPVLLITFRSSPKSLTFKIPLLPNCLFNFINNSPEPVSPLCSSLSPDAPTSFSPVLLFMLFLTFSSPFFSIIIKTLPVSEVGSWWESSQILPAYHMPCLQDCNAWGDEVHVPLAQCLHSRQRCASEHTERAPLQMLFTLEVFFFFAVGTKGSGGERINLTSHSRARTHLRQQTLSPYIVWLASHHPLPPLLMRWIIEHLKWVHVCLPIFCF